MLSLILLLSFAAHCYFAVVDILLVFSMLLLLSFCCWRFAVSFAVVVVHSCAVILLSLSFFCCYHLVSRNNPVNSIVCGVMVCYQYVIICFTCFDVLALVRCKLRLWYYRMFDSRLRKSNHMCINFA